jgi:hypothetical protein
MKRFSILGVGLILAVAISAAAAPNSSAAKVPAFPGTLANARYVYVASYDGDQFNPNCFPTIATPSAPCNPLFRIGR